MKAKVTWKLKALPFVGGGATKEELGKRKEELKEHLKVKKWEVERTEKELSEKPHVVTVSSEDVEKDVLGGDKGMKAFEEKKQEIEAIELEIRQVEKRELAIAVGRKQKEQKLAKVREKTQAIDERYGDRLTHTTGNTHDQDVDRWLEDEVRLDKEKRGEYLLNKKLEKQYEEELSQPDREPPPRSKRAMDEEEKQRAAWRKAVAAFQPYKKLAERARGNEGEVKEEVATSIEERHGSGMDEEEKKRHEEQQQQQQKALERLKQCEEKYAEALKAGEAMKKAGEDEQARDEAYEKGIKLLEEATQLAKEARKALDEEFEKVRGETRSAAKEQEEAFTFTVDVKDKKEGFDTDTDARNFYLANSVNELGGLVESEQYKKMKKVLKDRARRKEQLQKMGASIAEIVEAVYKNVPKNFWPDDVVKEVVLYKASKKLIDAEEVLAESELQLNAIMEKVEEGGEKAEYSSNAYEYSLAADTIKEKLKTKEWAGQKIDGKYVDVDTSKITDALSHFSDVFTAVTDSSQGFLKGAEALDKQSEFGEEDKDENPVKAKILEFQRNKALIECAQSLFAAGGDVAGEALMGEALPILSAITASKDVISDIAGAVTYFKNLAQIEKLKKGAKLDPRSAALLPLARQAREQGIEASDKLVSAVANLLKVAGKTGEAAGLTAPVGLIIDGVSKAVKFGGSVIISGFKWSDAAKAAKAIKLAAGPPPSRKAQISVMEHSSKYARVALAHLALMEHDPWAIGHLENMGLKREEIIIPEATSINLLREYMTLMSGGLMADGLGEEQKTIGESFEGTKVGKGVQFLARGIVKGVEKVRDLIVDRDTSVPYDPDWRLDGTKVSFSIQAWQTARGQAVKAGWYDSRPAVDADLAAYQQALVAYMVAVKNDEGPKKLEGEALQKAIDHASEVMAAVVAIGNRIREIKAVANDRVTPHAGMAAFLEGWYRRSQEEPKRFIHARSLWIDRLGFPGSKDLENDKKKFLEEAETKARDKQIQKAEDVRRLIDELWRKHEIPSPYGSAKIEDFTAKAKKALNLDDTGAKDLQVEVGDLSGMFHERLSQEVMATPGNETNEKAFQKELKMRFENSVKTVNPLAVEALRAACESVYKEMTSRTGVGGGDDSWVPSVSDVVLTKDAWENVKKSAMNKGWKKDGDADLTTPLKGYADALGKFEELSKNSSREKVVTQLDQAQGRLMGTIDLLETALNKFRPLTEKKFNHTGLCVWRDEMMDQCLAARMRYEKFESE